MAQLPNLQEATTLNVADEWLLRQSGVDKRIRFSIADAISWGRRNGYTYQGEYSDDPTLTGEEDFVFYEGLLYFGVSALTYPYDIDSTTYTDPSTDTNLLLTEDVDTKSYSQAEEQITGLKVYPESPKYTASTSSPYNKCPSGTTALRDAVNNKIYLTSEEVSGEITAIDFSAGTATAGGVSVSLVERSSEFIFSNIPELLSNAGALTEGDKCTTGGTAWEVITDSSQGLATNVSGIYVKPLTDVYLRDFGAVGDYDTEDTDAIDLANTTLEDWPWFLHLGTGIYRYEGSLDWLGICRLRGDYAPMLQPFPLLDDKVYLRPGYKNKMPGASIIFSGTATSTATLDNRDDDYNSFTYMFKHERNVAHRIEGVALIQDMNVMDAAGDWTELGLESAADFDAGLYNDDSAQSIYKDYVCWGYFPVAGTVIHSRDGFDDPDYNQFWGGSTMGRHGLALIGSNTGAVDEGLSGTQTYGFDMSTLDHHNRVDGDKTTYYADADTWRCVYVDGDVDATTAEINGHYFTGGAIRSYSDAMLEIDHASNVNFIDVVIESPNYGVPNSTGMEFVGSANVKKSVSFINCRQNFTSGIFNDGFAGVIPVPINIIGDPLGGSIAVSNLDPNVSGGYSVVRLGADGGVGDAAVQFTRDITSENSDWKMMLDVSSSEMQVRYEGAQVLRVDTSGRVIASKFGHFQVDETVSSGSIAFSGSYINVSGEGSAADNLTTITGGFVGDVVYLKRASDAITVISGTGNLRLAGGVDFTLSDALDHIELIYNGSQWCEVSRSSNAT